jgi:hypothetical protein
MFFSIDKTKQENFVCDFQFDNFFISVDFGWETYETEKHVVIYKGYADYHHLRDLLDELITETEPSRTGNYCAIVYHKTDNTISIKSDRYRSFPIYLNNGNKVTNLVKQDRTAWTDSLITITDNFEIIENKFDAIGTIDVSTISLEYGIESIASILDRKTKSLIDLRSSLPMAFRKPIHTFLSGGVDSLLVYSFLQKHTQDYKLIKYAHVDYTDFWLMNSGDIVDNWGYKQIHHWINPCILTSGAPGDEFMLRSPVTANIFLQNNGTDLLKMNQDVTSLHYSYFSLPKHKKVVENLASDFEVNKNLNKKELIWKLCNIIINDWQHWHIENTLTWTPLRDLEIFKIILQMPYEVQIKQIFDSYISKRLISDINPQFVNLISHQKNTASMMSNLINFYRQHH